MTVAEVDIVIVNRVDDKATVANRDDATNQSDVATQTNSGAIVLIASDGNLTITDGGDGDAVGVAANGAGNILLESVLADVIVNAGVQSENGNISVLGHGNVTQGSTGNVNVTVGTGTIDVEAVTGAITMSDGAQATTVDANIRYQAKTDLALSLIHI